MTDRHPERRRIELFMRGDLPGEDSRDLVIHLLSGCETCRRVARESFPCDSPEVQSASELPERWQATAAGRYAQVFDRVLPAVRKAEEDLEDDRILGPQLLDELEHHPHERRLLLVRNSRRFRSWSLCEVILDRAYSLGFKNPSSAIEFSELAIEVADSVDEDALSAQLVLDLQSRTHSILGNALRISGDLQRAAKEFELAENLLAQGSRDELEQARFAELKSHLLFELRDFESSIQLLNQAIKVYRSHREEHRLGRALISRGYQQSEKGDLGSAIGSLRQGLRNIDPIREPRVVLVAKHNLVHHLYDTARYHQALALVPETMKLHQQHGNEMDMTRFRWLVGQILRDCGRIEDAEDELLGVREFFVAQQVAHDTALVSLDLAVIYLRKRRTAELKELATEMLTIFHALRVNREAIAALVLFQKAVEVERVTLGLVRDLAAYLKSARHDPHLPFRPSSTG